MLLDTHALLWWLSDDESLPQSVRKLIARPNNKVMISAASAWEIATKVRLGKLPVAADLAADFSGYLAREHFEGLPVSMEHAVRAGLLPGPHKDPFDRIIVAHAKANGTALLLTKDEVIRAHYPNARW